jgi:hypothetical protein
VVTVKGIMQDIAGVAQALGLSVRAVRLRRDALAGILDVHVKRGEKGALLFTGEALAILRRVEDVRRGESVSVRQAVERVRGELQGNGEHASRQPESTSAATSSDSSMMQVMLEDLRRDRDAWRNLALRLQDQLALPAPRPWWSRLFGMATG